MDPNDLGPSAFAWLGGSGTILLGVFLWLRKFLSKDATERVMDNADIGTVKDLYGSYGYVFCDVVADLRFFEEPGELDIDEAWQEPEAFDGCSTRGQARPDAPQPVHFVRDRASHQIGAAK